MLSQRDIDTLAGIIGSDFKQKWEGIIAKASRAGKITVANTGLYSSGKSSLFNAVLGRVTDDNMRFKVGVIPTTKTGDREAFTGNVELLDTPGIDAKQEDDAVAFDMLMQSDIIMMTHNVKRGPLDRPEVTWLERIAGNIDPSVLTERLVFVSTWVDEIRDEHDMQELRDEIYRQVDDIVNHAPIAFMEVSSKRYKTGVEKGKKVLEDASGIPALKDLIIAMAGNFAKKSETLRKQELLRLCSDSKHLLQNKRRKTDEEITAKRRRVSDRYAGAFQTWRGIFSRFTNMRAGVSSKLAECKSIQYDSSFERRIYDM